MKAVVTDASVSRFEPRRKPRVDPMRILVISPELPYPPSWGFSIRVSRVLALLARRHAVSLLSYTSDSDRSKVDALAATCEAVHVVRDNPASGPKRLGQLASLLSPASFQGRYLYTDAMQRALDELCAKQRFDIIQVEGSPMATFRFDPRAKLVIVEHDIVYELLRRIAGAERSLVRRIYNAAEARKYQREEIARLNAAAACVLTSSREVPIVRQAGVTGPVLVAPNGVDVDYFQPSAAPPDSETLVMTGLMRTRPNIDAAVYFVEQVFPAILARRPRAKLFVVGGDPPADVLRLAGTNVVVTGTVPDVRPFVHKAAVVVVPMRMGGGTRLKVLEGLAMEKPMVSTTLGCEGIDVQHEQHLLIADEPPAFAAAVLRLMDDQASGVELARRGYALVQERYRWETITDRLEQLYEELVSTRQPA